MVVVAGVLDGSGNILAGKVVFSDVEKRVPMADTTTRLQCVGNILDELFLTLH
jgi:hypothetical protein